MGKPNLHELRATLAELERWALSQAMYGRRLPAVERTMLTLRGEAQAVRLAAEVGGAADSPVMLGWIEGHAAALIREAQELGFRPSRAGELMQVRHRQ